MPNRSGPTGVPSRSSRWQFEHDLTKIFRPWAGSAGQARRPICSLRTRRRDCRPPRRQRFCGPLADGRVASRRSIGVGGANRSCRPARRPTPGPTAVVQRRGPGEHGRKYRLAQGGRVAGEPGRGQQFGRQGRIVEIPSASTAATATSEGWCGSASTTSAGPTSAAWPSPKRPAAACSPPRAIAGHRRRSWPLGLAARRRTHRRRRACRPIC